MAVIESSGARFDLGRVVSRTFGLVGRNFIPFAVLSLIFTVVPMVIVMLLQPTLFAQQDPGTVFFVGKVLVSYLAGLVLTAALTRASVDDLSGKTVEIGSALTEGIRLMLPMLGLGIVMGAAILFGLLLLVIPAIYLTLRWAVAAPVLVIEEVGVFKAMERSASLTQDHRWAILGLMVLALIALMVVQAIVVVLTAPMMAGLGGGIVAIVPVSVVHIAASMVLNVGVAATYFELRQIKEGVDVSGVARVFA